MPAPLTHKRCHRLERLTLNDLRALDRTHTVVLLPVGMIEQHGPHLPLGTDGFAVDALAQAASAWLLDHDPDLHVLVMPTIPYGTAPTDARRPELFASAGSVWVRRETLKAVVTDVAAHMVRYGFRYIFPVGFHGGADQSRLLAEVCAEMCARYAGLVMAEPVGYVLAGAALDVTPGLATLLGRPLTIQEEVALQGSIHASMFETSMMLHLAPDLVNPSYKTLRSLEWSQMYGMEDWPGYVGSGPVHANADVGAAVLRWRGVRAAALIRRAMGGENITALPRHPVYNGVEEENEDSSDIKTPAALDVPAHENPTPPSWTMRTKAGGDTPPPDSDNV